MEWYVNNNKFRNTKTKIFLFPYVVTDLFLKFVPKIRENCRLTHVWLLEITHPYQQDKAAAAFLASTDWEGRAEQWQQSRSNILSAEAST